MAEHTVAFIEYPKLYLNQTASPICKVMVHVSLSLHVSYKESILQNYIFFSS